MLFVLKLRPAGSMLKASAFEAETRLFKFKL
jgi:hypothetical protein